MRCAAMFMMFIVALVAACDSPTQTSDRGSDAAANAKGDEQGTSEWPASPRERQDAVAQTLEKLKQDFQELVAQVQEDIANASTAAEKKAVFSQSNPLPQHIEDLLDLAKSAPDTQAALDATLEAVTLSSGDNKNRAMTYLLNTFADRLELNKIVDALNDEIPGPDVESWIRMVINKSPDDETRAKAIIGLATYVDQLPFFKLSLAKNPHLLDRMPEDQVAYLNVQPDEKLKADVDAMLEQVIADYSEIPFSANKSCGEVAKASLYELRHLSVGCVAPDIHGEDLDGTPFKLSDYRGKVVMLDFWGNWCPPCRAMYPHERQMVDELSGLPFALVGVNSDRIHSQAKEVVRRENLQWRNFWDGELGTEGPISRQWNVDAWPTIYLIDAQGVIRYKDVLGEDIDRAIEILLAEMGHEVQIAPPSE